MVSLSFCLKEETAVGLTVPLLQSKFGREHVRLGVAAGASSSTKFKHVLLLFMFSPLPCCLPVPGLKNGKRRVEDGQEAHCCGLTVRWQGLVVA